MTTWLRTSRDGFDDVFALRQAAHDRFGELYAGLWKGGVDATTLDACAARITALLRFAPDPTSELDLGPAARAAVAYAEQYALRYAHRLWDRYFAAFDG